MKRRRTVGDVLDEAYHLLDDKANWTRNVFSKREDGRQKRCAWGAIFAATPGSGDGPGTLRSRAGAAMTVVTKRKFGKSLVAVNDDDDLGYAAIRGVFRTAIKEARRTE